MATSVKRPLQRRVLIVPLIRVTPSLAALSYTVPEGLDVFPGACVHIPFRTKVIEGIVWDEDRSGERRGTKAVIDRKGQLHVPAVQFNLAKWIHAETLTPLNVVLRSMVLADGPRVAVPQRKQVSPTIVECPSGFARQQVLNEWSQRIAVDRGKTVVVVPNQGVASQWMATLAVLKPLHLTPARSSAAERRLRQDLQSTNIFITTHVGLLHPLPQIDRVILDLADDEGYFAFDQAPRLDIRSLVREFSWLHSASLLVLTRWMCPPLRGLFKAAQPTVIGGLPAVTLIDRQNEPSSERGRLPPTYLLEKLQGSRTLWLHSRTSEAGRYVCFDCGSAVPCPTCAKPLRVCSRKPLTLECLRDHVRIAAPNTCATCNGTNLSTRGPGVQQVARAICELVGRSAVATLERGTTQGNLRTALHVVSTTAIGSFPTLSFVAVVFLQPDSYFSQQGYRSTEQFFSALALTRAMLAPKGSLYVVTYKPDAPAYQYLKNPDSWTQQTLVERSKRNYPPTGTMVVLQPRKRIARPAARAFMEATLPQGVTITQLGTAWLLRTAPDQHSALLTFLQNHLDPTWEAIVNPPTLPQD